MSWPNSSLSIRQDYQFAIQHHNAGNFREAEILYRRILVQQPDHADTLHMLGLLAQQAGHLSDAAALMQSAIRIDPNVGIYHGHLGLVYRAMGKPPEELAEYRRAAELSPNVPEAHYNLGTALMNLGQADAAIAAYRAGLSLRADFAEAHNNLGHALRETGLLEDAAVHGRRAVELRPTFAEAFNNLGCTLMELHRLSEAIAALQQALALRPHYPEALNNLGNTLRLASRLNEAVAALRRSLELRPGFPDALWNLSLVLLLQDHTAEGWSAYEARRQLRQRFIHYDFSEPEWTGGPVSGQRILLHAEQGFGDTIQMVRYARLLSEQGAHVYLECQPPLERLMQGANGVERVIARGQALPAFDLHCPIMSLPGRFNTTTATIPRDVPYLHMPQPLLDRWQQTLQSSDNQLKVGLVWSGRPYPRNRSIPPELLEPLLGVEGVRFYSLQPRESGAVPTTLPARFSVVDCADDLRDFTDTGAALCNLDLLITIDTAAAHLAGALGRPAWVLLQSACDWRWFTQRSDSPCYPSLRLFRQPAPGDWPTPLGQIVAALKKLAKDRGAT